MCVHIVHTGVVQTKSQTKAGSSSTTQETTTPQMAKSAHQHYRSVHRPRLRELDQNLNLDGSRGRALDDFHLIPQTNLREGDLTSWQFQH